MILSIEHTLMVSGPDIKTCGHRVQNFFEKSQLVRYDSIEIDRQNSFNGTAPQFKELLSKTIARNHEILADLLSKLKNESCHELEDLLQLPQGFQSKLLHTMSHLLDGFFGVDSHFFDIDEISHWLTENRRKKIKESPDECWLVSVKAKSVYGEGFESKAGN
jgi:hypothetical protein